MARLVSTQLKLEFYENDKEKNKEISRYVRKYQEKEDSKRILSEFAENRNEFFDSMRVLYYGDDWIQLLFPSLF